MAIRRRRSVFDIVNEYFDSVEEWAEHFEESLMEKPSWNQETCAFEPLRDVVVTPNEVLVTVVLPLTEENTVQVKPAGKNLLDITAKMKRKVKFEEFGITHRKGEFQTFHCQMRIPVQVQMDKIHFRCKKGLLEIHLPRKSI